MVQKDTIYKCFVREILLESNSDTDDTDNKSSTLTVSTR